ncbi:hypothetical protein REPUB_Repub12eG0192500 [Reevesia pubescens]
MEPVAEVDRYLHLFGHFVNACNQIDCTICIEKGCCPCYTMGGAEAFNGLENVIIIFASLALLSVVCLPSTPSMWMAGMTFGYGNGFLLVMAGVSIGVSLPYFLGSIFHTKILRLLEKHPKLASTLRLAGEGNWLHQFQPVTLIRIVYKERRKIVVHFCRFNYAVVATNANYGPYLLGTLVGMVPEVFVALYSGILIRSFEEATQDKKTISTRRIVFNIVGFCASVTATVFIGIQTKRRLDRQHEEELIPHQNRFSFMRVGD